MGNRTYYNEIDPFAAAWLRNLIKEKLIPDGDVDERSIADVQPVDLKDYAQCHFFAGIGGWSYALQLAGWPDDEPVWTGSCPCQPFSVAGRGKGTADERHLWPEFYRLIRECRPSIVFGEQVASRAGREWFAGVRADLEDVGYGAAAADLCAASVRAPHIRQRLYWVGVDDADSNRALGKGSEKFVADARCPRDSSDVVGAASIGRREGRTEHELRSGWTTASGTSSGDMADTDSPERGAAAEGRRHDDDRADAGREEAPGGYQFHRAGNNMAHAARISEREPHDDMRTVSRENPRTSAGGGGERHGVSFWSDSEWRRGADGKERRVKSGVRLLVDGVPNRVGRLRGYGNAIVPQVAAAFIKACV